MSGSADSQIASLLSALSISDDTLDCPLGIFALRLKGLFRRNEESSLGDILAERSMMLVQEEEALNAEKEMTSLAYDKLRAEITRVEAQLREQERELKDVVQQKKLCKSALNMVVTGNVPRFIDADAVSAGNNAEPPVRGRKTRADNEDGHLHPSMAAPEPISMNSASPTTRQANSSGSTPKPTKTGGGVGAPQTSPRAAGVTATSLIAMLRLPDVKENALLSAIESYEQSTFSSKAWMSNDAYPDVLKVLLALLKHLPEPRPPVQIAELRILCTVLQVSPTSDAQHNKNLLTMLEALVKQGDAMPILIKLLSSVNNDVKCDALECLTPLVCGSHALVTAAGSNLSTHARRAFLSHSGLDPLVNIVVCSTSESVLERALVFLWGLLSKDEKVSSDGKSIKAEVRVLGGLKAVLDLLYSDSLSILENVCMVIGYITREETAKKEVRDVGGLEKITATLRHPSDSIKTKMASAVWNCASNPENRISLRKLGAIPALLELLRPSSPTSENIEFLRENAAGALWNLSVDGDNKKQIIEYGGVPLLIQVMATSSSTSVVENISGTLWNCSALNESRPVIRKVGGIPILLSLLNERKAPPGSANPRMPLSEKIVDNVVGTLRNCAIHDQTKPIIREAGGVELLLGKLKEGLLDVKGKALSPVGWSTLDKMASTLWILTISPEIKHTVKLAGGIQILVKILEMSSPIYAAAASKGSSKVPNLFPPQKPARAGRHTPASLEVYENYYSPAALQKVPSATPAISVPMNIKEKLAGVLRNCSTIAENRADMIKAGAVRALVSVILDCFSSRSTFLSSAPPGNNASSANAHKNCVLNEPSSQLKESVSSALWFLSRDDKVTPSEQGGLELMCMFLVTPKQLAVVQEQAAGALSSLTVTSPENRELVRGFGALQSLIQLVVSKAKEEYPARRNADGDRGGSRTDTYASLNALLTIRNCAMNNDDTLKYCSDLVVEGKAEFIRAVLHLVQYGSEESSREAALTIKYMSSSSRLRELFVGSDAVPLLNALSERTSSDAVRKAVASALHAVARTARSSARSEA